MTQNPTYFCAKCHTTRPPLLAGRTYTCVMCGKTRSPEEYRSELAKLRRAAEKAAAGGPSAVQFAPPTPEAPPAPPPAPVAKAAPVAPAVAKVAPVRVEAAPKVAAEASEYVCAWRECSNEARHKSKYCSRACSNKNARARHARRRTDPI